MQVQQAFLGRSFLVGLCDDSHFTGLDRPAHIYEVF